MKISFIKIAICLFFSFIYLDSLVYAGPFWSLIRRGGEQTDDDKGALRIPTPLKDGENDSPLAGTPAAAAATPAPEGPASSSTSPTSSISLATTASSSLEIAEDPLYLKRLQTLRHIAGSKYPGTVEDATIVTLAQRLRGLDHLSVSSEDGSLITWAMKLTLTGELTIEGNLGSSGIAAIRQGLLCNTPSLASLHFQKAVFPRNAATEIAWGLRKNSVLTRLIFNEMSFTGTDIGGLLHAFSSHQTVRTAGMLNNRNNPFDETIALSIQRIINGSPNLTLQCSKEAFMPDTHSSLEANERIIFFERIIFL